MTEPSKPRSGFTMIEILFATGLVILAMGMSIGFLVESVKANFISAEKNDINTDLRRVVDRLARDARQANFFLLYNSVADADRNSSADRLRAGRSGDFLVLIEKVPYDKYVTDAETRQPRPIRGITIYYRDPNETIDGEIAGPVRVWRGIYAPDEDLADDDPDKAYRLRNDYIKEYQDIVNPERLFPSVSDLSNAAELIEISVGLADGKLFYNHNDQTIMVNGKIIHGNVAKRVTDTYNFSISPRG